MTFTCSKDGDFESAAKLRAHCPKCGEVVKRFGGENKPEPEQQKSEPVQETTGSESSDSPENKSEETEPKEKSEPKKKTLAERPKRIRVVEKKTTSNRTVGKKPVGSRPIIKTRVKTNVDKKAAKETQTNETTWNKVRKAGWF